MARPHKATNVFPTKREISNLINDLREKAKAGDTGATEALVRINLLKMKEKTCTQHSS